MALTDTLKAYVLAHCRGSLAFSSGSDATSDTSSSKDTRRSLYGLTMGDSSGIGRGGSPGAARGAGVATFESAPAEGGIGRKQPQGSTFASMAFADIEKENEVCLQVNTTA